MNTNEQIKEEILATLWITEYLGTGKYLGMLYI